jgi:hypothetical protein
MAKVTEVSDSEESKAAVASTIQSPSNKVKEASVEVESEAENGEDNEEEQEEYEIEKIMDAKRGYFPGVSYFVRRGAYRLTTRFFAR